jgi:hypothetical protein
MVQRYMLAKDVNGEESEEGLTYDGGRGKL